MSSRRSGFTLLELMIASVLMALIVGSVLSLAGSVLGHWNREVAVAAVAAQAHAALDLLAEDLAGVLLTAGRHGGENMLALEVLAVEDAGRTRMMLRFFSDSAGPAGESGSTRAVAWMAAIDPGDSLFVDDFLPSLFRVVVPAENTWQAWRAEGTAALAGRVPTGSEVAEGFLLAGCVGFQIGAWGWDAEGSPVPLQALAPDRLSEPGDRLLFPVDSARETSLGFPAFFDVVLHVLAPGDADAYRRQIGHGEVEGFDAEAWILEHAQTFHRRIFVGHPSRLAVR